MKAIRDILINTSAVTGLFINGASDITFTDSPQQRKPPFIVIKGQIVNPHDSNSGQNMDEWDIEIFIIAQKEYTANGKVGVMNIADTIRAALHGTKGIIEGASVNDTKFNDQGDIIRLQGGGDQRVQLDQSYTQWINRT